MSPRTSQSRLVPAWIFWGVQALVLPVLLIAPWLRAATMSVDPTQPAILSEPLRVEPLYNNPLVITDEQLGLVLERLRPRFRHDEPKINHVDHALRMWGVEAKFPDPEALSGEEMRQLLTDHQAFAKAWGPKARPLLMARDGGIVVRTQEGNATASHVDHTLATLAECGTPLDFPLRLSDRSATFADLLRQAIVSFDLNQIEYEWTTLALALYAPEQEPWYTASGERIDFDRIAQRLMRQQYAQGVCFGNHRLYTLTILLRVDESRPLLSPDVRQEILAHLSEATQRLVQTQHADGFWDKNWPDRRIVIKEDEGGGPLARRMLATGHALEWWAMAPAELQPPRETLVRAGQWLVRELERMDKTTLEKNYTFLSHVGRALALWRGGFPAGLQARVTSLN